MHKQDCEHLKQTPEERSKFINADDRGGEQCGLREASQRLQEHRRNLRQVQWLGLGAFTVGVQV